MNDRRVIYLDNPLARRAAARAVSDAPDGYRCELRPRTRSLAQNDLLWSALTDISKQVRWAVNGKEETLAPAEWKNLFSAALHEENRMAMGIRGGFVMLGRSTSKMAVKQMADLITMIHAFGAENGVTWSPASVGRDQ